MAFTVNEQKEFNGIPLNSQYYRIAIQAYVNGEITASILPFASKAAYEADNKLQHFKTPCTRFRMDLQTDPETGVILVDENGENLTYRNEWADMFDFDKELIMLDTVISNAEVNYLAVITDEVITKLVELKIIDDIANVVIDLN